MESISETITCPITHQIFDDPVIASDGHIYERSAIKKWLSISNESPISGLVITNELIPCYFAKKIIDDFLMIYPDESVHKFKKTNSHHDNIEEIKCIIAERNYDLLVSYIEFDLDLLKYDIVEIVKSIPIDIFKHLIDNTIDLNCKLTNLGGRLFNFVVAYSTPEMTKYLIDKGIELEYTCDGWRPIHVVCRRSTPEIIKCVIDNGVDLECEMTSGWRPIHLLCKYSTSSMIKYVIDKNVNLECETKLKMRPIHLACHSSNSEAIMYLIGKGVDLNCTSSAGYKPLHYLCQRNIPQVLSYFIKQNVDLEYENEKGWRPIHYCARYGSKSTMELMINAGVNLSGCYLKNPTKPIRHKKSPNSLLESALHLIFDWNTLSTIDLVKKNKKLNAQDMQSVLDLIRSSKK